MSEYGDSDSWYSREIEKLEAENEMLRDQVRQMLNVPEFARNHAKDQCIAKLHEALNAILVSYDMPNTVCAIAQRALEETNVKI